MFTTMMVLGMCLVIKNSKVIASIVQAATVNVVNHSLISFWEAHDQSMHRNVRTIDFGVCVAKLSVAGGP